ncbi:hypothetical protein [Corallococcus llansteffanensis]|uniref:hypothetical protein n=1 Tax=Corallococcus llansteffanensis TaxID=2316731 RepID=UPI0013158410|nr:hypothetical protein [Corallococcus llansteffanensis]
MKRRIRGVGSFPDLAVEATSITGATVTYAAATASDAVSDVTVGYGRTSGSH